MESRAQTIELNAKTQGEENQPAEGRPECQDLAEFDFGCGRSPPSRLCNQRYRQTWQKVEDKGDYNDSCAWNKQRIDRNFHDRLRVVIQQDRHDPCHHRVDRHVKFWKFDHIISLPMRISRGLIVAIQMSGSRSLRQPRHPVQDPVTALYLMALYDFEVP